MEHPALDSKELRPPPAQDACLDPGIPIVLAHFYQMVALGILTLWAVAGVSLPVLGIGMSETVRAGNRLPMSLRATSRFGSWLAAALRLE